MERRELLLGKGKHDGSINCHGSALCNQDDVWWDPIPTYLDIARKAVKLTGILKYGNIIMYRHEQHVMCRGHEVHFCATCVFLQGAGVLEDGVPMQIIIDRLAMLKGFGCRVCGSVLLSRV